MRTQKWAFNPSRDVELRWGLRAGEAWEVTRLPRILSSFLSAQPLLSEDSQRAGSCHHLCLGKTMSSFINKEEKEHILPFFIIHKISENPSQFLVSCNTLIRPSTMYKNMDDPSRDAEAPTIRTSGPPASKHIGLGGVQRILSKFQCTRDVSFCSTQSLAHKFANNRLH